MPATVIIRARPETRDLLRDLARVDGASAIDTLEHVVREAAEARLLKAVVADLSSTPSHTEAELAVWDATLADGLDPDEDFSAWR
jgi:hypothetical protein